MENEDIIDERNQWFRTECLPIVDDDVRLCYKYLGRYLGNDSENRSSIFARETISWCQSGATSIANQLVKRPDIPVGVRAYAFRIIVVYDCLREASFSVLSNVDMREITRLLEEQCNNDFDRLEIVNLVSLLISSPALWKANKPILRKALKKIADDLGERFSQSLWNRQHAQQATLVIRNSLRARIERLPE
jgi:hypothetical protein